MSQRLPTHRSKWMKDSELINDEVIKLWKSHNDYLLAPEKMKIDTTNNLLETFIQNITMFYITEILNNILNLEWYLKKVHRWMEPYIKKNTNLRKTASNSFEKDFFNLMNNSVFWKTIENIRKRQNVTLIDDGKQAIKLSSKLNFDRATIFHGTFIAVHMKKTEVFF